MQWRRRLGVGRVYRCGVRRHRDPAARLVARALALAHAVGIWVPAGPASPAATPATGGGSLEAGHQSLRGPRNRFEAISLAPTGGRKKHWSNDRDPVPPPTTPSPPNARAAWRSLHPACCGRSSTRCCAPATEGSLSGHWPPARPFSPTGRGPGNHYQ